MIVKRATIIDPDEAEHVKGLLCDYLDDWEALAPQFTSYWNDFAPKKSLMISAEKVAETRSRYGSYSGIARATPNSMRNVEGGTAFKMKEDLD